MLKRDKKNYFISKTLSFMLYAIVSWNKLTEGSTMQCYQSPLTSVFRVADSTEHVFIRMSTFRNKF